jgi:hypothetical protein
MLDTPPPPPHSEPTLLAEPRAEPPPKTRSAVGPPTPAVCTARISTRPAPAPREENGMRRLVFSFALAQFALAPDASQYLRCQFRRSFFDQ